VAFGERSGDQLRFRHLLIRDAAYGSLPKSRRAALHDQFGSALEAAAGDPDQFTEILAHHAERAFTLSRELAIEGEALYARARRAIQWSLPTADRARTRHDIRNLEAALHTARSAASALPDGGGLEFRARIRLLEAQLMVVRADYSGASVAAADAANLAEQGNLLPLVATARLTEAWILTWAGAGPMKDFEGLIERAVAAARRAGDIEAEIEARHIGTNIQFATGHLDEFVALNQTLLEQARSIGDDAHTATILERLQQVELNRGNLEVSSRYAAEADAIATRLGLRSVVLTVWLRRANRLLFKGDFDAAVNEYSRLLAACADAGAAQLEIGALRFLGMARRFQRRFSEMAEVLDRAIELSDSTGERWNRAELLGLRARASLELGDIEAADRFIRRALEAQRQEDVTGISEVHGHLGMIRAAQGRDAEAETALRDSVDVVIRTQYVFVLANAVIDLAKFLAQRGRLAEASSLMEPYAQTGQARGWHCWDGEIDAVRGLIAAHSRQAGT